MHVISRKLLREFCEKHSDASEPLYDWYRIASRSQWQNLLDVQQTYAKAEAVGNFTVFNIKGNRYRLVVDLVYQTRRIYVKYILTHAEYDKDEWKNDDYF